MEIMYARKNVRFLDKGKEQKLEFCGKELMLKWTLR